MIQLLRRLRGIFTLGFAGQASSVLSVLEVEDEVTAEVRGRTAEEAVTTILTIDLDASPRIEYEDIINRSGMRWIEGWRRDGKGDGSEVRKPEL
jgi:hypothetical protein